ncbi:hypothetical protein [Nocardia altamirensis]|uniref:hypothetical protein n=1 Tax=Nocardia altamirensis TaxID=472158 RepID=UPI0008405AEF|nr:hypothetical protein [Nocardia altamirensis]
MMMQQSKDTQDAAELAERDAAQLAEREATALAERNARWDAAAAELRQLYQHEFQILTTLGAHPFIRDNGGMTLWAIESDLCPTHDPDNTLYLIATSTDHNLATNRDDITEWSVSIYERATDEPVGEGTDPTDFLAAYCRAFEDYHRTHPTPTEGTPMPAKEFRAAFSSYSAEIDVSDPADEHMPPVDSYPGGDERLPDDITPEKATQMLAENGYIVVGEWELVDPDEGGYSATVHLAPEHAAPVDPTSDN